MVLPKNGEGSVDMSPPGKVREHIGTKSRNQVENPTRNPTRFLLGRIRSIPTMEAELISMVLRRSNKIAKIQQEYPTSNWFTGLKKFLAYPLAQIALQ